MSAFEDHLGKISADTFKEVLFPQRGYERKEVLVGPSFGVDTSVIALGNGKAMAVSSDPLTLIPSLGMEASAWLSVHLTANDMATTGISPQYAQFVLNLPPTLSLEGFKEYWGHIHHQCKTLGVAITGGHTGQVAGQNSTLPGSVTMFLTASKREIITSNKARPGDVILVTKSAALSSTAILAQCFPKTVQDKCGVEVYHKACENFYRTSSLQDAILAAEILAPNAELKAMHDVTEGGILGAVYEMAIASQCGFTVNSDLIPVGPAVRAVAELFEIDPLYSIGTGAMIIAIKQGNEMRLINHLMANGIDATVIGEFSKPANGHKLITKDREKDFTFSGKDPYWTAFFQAVKEGLK